MPASTATPILADTARMAKPLCAILVAFAFGYGGTNTMGFTINPDPPIAGQTATITYDLPNAKLKIEYDPGGVIDVVTDWAGEVRVTIPAGTTSLTVWDPDDPQGATAWVCG